MIGFPPRMPFRRLLCAQLPLALFTAATSAEPAAGRIHLSVEETLTCPSKNEVREALAAQLGEGRLSDAPPRPGEVVLRLSRAPEGCLRLSLARGEEQPSLERCLAVRTTDCKDLPDAVALTVHAFLMRVPWNLALSPPRAAADVRRTRAEARGKEHPAPLRVSPRAPPEPIAQGPRPIEVAPPVAPPAQEPAPQEPAPQEPAPQASRSDSPPPPRVSRLLILRVLGGASSDASVGQRTVAGLLGAQLALAERWGVGLQVTVDAPVRAESRGGSVSAWSADVHAVGQFSAIVAKRLRVHLFADAGVELIAASSRNYAETGTAVLVRFGAGAAVELDLQVTESVAVAVSLGPRVRPSREALTIDNVGTVLTLGTIRLFALVGLSFSPL